MRLSTLNLSLWTEDDYKQLLNLYVNWIKRADNAEFLVDPDQQTNYLSPNTVRVKSVKNLHSILFK